MRKISVIVACLLALVSCSEKQLVVPGEKPDQVFATLGSENGGTKAMFGTIASAVYPHIWEMGDEISVFWGTTENLWYRCTDISSNGNAGSNVKYSVFRYLDKGHVAGTELQDGNGYAIYPYSESNDLTSNMRARVDFATEQTYRSGNYGTAQFGSTPFGCAVFFGTNKFSEKGAGYFRFYNVGCWLRLPIKSSTGVTIKKIVLVNSAGTETNEGVLAGRPRIEFDSSTNVPVIREDAIDTPSKTLTLNCGSVSVGSTATDFYFYMIPQTVTPNITITAYDTSDAVVGTAVLTATGDRPISASTFARNRVVKLTDWEIGSEQIAFNLSVDSWTDVTTDVTLK